MISKPEAGNQKPERAVLKEKKESGRQQRQADNQP
jgi:hypothetical protein